MPAESIASLFERTKPHLWLSTYGVEKQKNSEWQGAKLHGGRQGHASWQSQSASSIGLVSLVNTMLKQSQTVGTVVHTSIIGFTCVGQIYYISDITVM